MAGFTGICSRHMRRRLARLIDIIVARYTVARDAGMVEMHIGPGRCIVAIRANIRSRRVTCDLASHINIVVAGHAGGGSGRMVHADIGPQCRHMAIGARVGGGQVISRLA